MTSKASLNPNISKNSLNLNLFNPPPKIGSSIVTDVLGEPSIKLEQTLVAVMDDFQRAQTRPTVTSALPPTRVTTVTEDLDALLDETLKDFNNLATSSASSSSSASIAASSLPSFGFDWELEDIEEVLLKLILMPETQLWSSSESKEAINAHIAEIAELLNAIIEQLNVFFKSFAESTNPKSWMDRAKETIFFWRTHPFGSSCVLMTHLDQATSLTPFLNKSVVAEWKKNYQQAVLILKKQGLDHDNETKFPFSGQANQMLSMAKIMSKQLQNPQLKKWMEQMSASMSNPDALLEPFKTQNPQLAAQFSQPMKKPMESDLADPIQSLTSFFQELEQVLQNHPNDALAVNAWLQEQVNKPTYPHHFYTMKGVSKASSRLPTEANGPLAKHPLLLKTYNDCCDRLTALGLQSYLNEGPSKQYLEETKQLILQNKPLIQSSLSICLPILKSLSEVLKKLNFAPETAEASRKIVEDWIARAKDSGGYEPPFPFCAQILENPSFYEGVFDASPLAEMNVLYPFCRDKLTTLGLSKYLEETPQIFGKTDLDRRMTDLDRFKRELAFFQKMIVQEDLAKWLEKNSPEADYPLLWAKKRMPQISRFRDTVDMETRRDWRMCAEACLEKVQGTALASHADIGQIPADASLELKVFLSQG
jgi:hypothetical protein